MSSSVKNIATILLALTFAFAGYYLYVQSKNSDLPSEGEVSLTEDMLKNTKVFIERRKVLDSIVIDTSVFQNPVFRSYQSFSEEVEEESFGRDNPFSSSPSRI